MRWRLRSGLGNYPVTPTGCSIVALRSKYQDWCCNIRIAQVTENSHPLQTAVPISVTSDLVYTDRAGTIRSSHS
jgi:hypothetical protein